MINFQQFPSLDNTDDDGLLAMGGNLSIDTLVSAYAQGIFPWFNNDQPILWWSPDPRLVLYPNQIKLSRSLKKSIKRKFNVTCNQAFEDVMHGCALRGAEREADQNNVSDDGIDQNTTDTWITKDMHKAYSELHHAGYAHSIETWQNNKLVGGLYGVCLGNVFFGESMFSRESDASKTALVYLCQHLLNQDFRLIDCQVASEHLFSLGAKEIPRSEFIQELNGINVNETSQFVAHEFPNCVDDLTVFFT